MCIRDRGQLIGYKVNGDRGPEWRIILKACLDTTQNAVPPSEDTTVDTEVMTDVETVSSEDMTDDRRVVTSNALAQLAEFYHEQIETLQEKLEAATYRNGYLEAQLSSAENQLKLLPDLSAKVTKFETLEQQIERLEAEITSHKQGFWKRFGAWFIGKV